MPDYKNGKIYTIRYKNDDTLIYVGSTTQPLYKRWFEHKCHCSKENNEHYNKYLYIKIRETDINNWYIELFEEFPCDNKEQLTKREGQVIREIGTLNKMIPGRTQKEYQEDNKDKLLEYRRKYKEDNKDKIKEYNEINKDKIKEYWRKYKEDNKDKIKEYQKEYNKSYRETNRDKKKDCDKQYREANKEKLKEMRKIKIICSCGCSISKINLKRHQQSKNHLETLQTIEDNKKFSQNN